MAPSAMGCNLVIRSQPERRFVEGWVSHGTIGNCVGDPAQREKGSLPGAIFAYQERYRTDHRILRLREAPDSLKLQMHSHDCVQDTLSNSASGSTVSHIKDPAAHKPAATRNDAVQLK
jgi:hypothetical protein